MQNGYIESFNGKFRDECLNNHWFADLDDAKAKIEDWRRDYNEVRPHQALGQQRPLSAHRSEPPYSARRRTAFALASLGIQVRFIQPMLLPAGELEDTGYDQQNTGQNPEDVYSGET